MVQKRLENHAAAQTAPFPFPRSPLLDRPERRLV
jgi:hypothetical protein